MTDNDDNPQSESHIPDFKKIKSEADIVKTKPIKEQVEFLYGKKDLSQWDIVYHTKRNQEFFRGVAFFLDDIKFNNFTRIYPALISNRHLELDDANKMIIYIDEYRLLETTFLSKVLPDFPKSTRPPIFQNRVNVQSKAKKILTRKILTRDEIWSSLPDCIYKTELNNKTALEALDKVIPNIKKMTDETEILVWNKLNIEFQETTYIHDAIWKGIHQKIKQITPSGTNFRNSFYYDYWVFPSLRLKYLKKGVTCLDWITQEHIIAEVTLAHHRGDEFLGRLFLAHYIEPKYTGIEPHSIFLTPLRLLECLTKGEKESDDVERVGHKDNRTNKDNRTVYSVKGYPKEVELPDPFIDWIKRFSSEKGLREFSATMLNLGVMDTPTYDIVMWRIESKIGPKIEIPSIDVKDTERLRIIYQVKMMPSFGQWVKVIEKYGKRSKGIVFKSTQGFMDFLKRMEAGDYLKVHREASGIKIELTEKGLRAIE